MNLPWPSLFKSSVKGWSAVDVGPDGLLVGVSVRPGAQAGARPQVVKCGQVTGAALVDAGLAGLARKISVGGFPWTVPLARNDYRILVVAEPPVLAAEMDRSLRWTLGPMVDFSIDEANLVWMKIPTAEFQPNRAKHLYAIVAQRSVVQQQVALFAQAKLALRAIDVRETAQRNIAALLEKKGEGLGLLSMGPHGVTITFTFGGELHLDRFIELSLAELLAADAPGQQKFFERIALQVSRSVDFIQRNNSFMPVERIMLAPLPAQIGLHDYLSQNLSVRVEALDLASVFDLSLTPELALPENQSRYLMALGAALRGVRKTE